jgi:hypothetical protein
MPLNKPRNMEHCLKMAFPNLLKGQPCPAEFQDPPYRIKDHPEANLINQILDKSTEIQSSTIPDTPLKEYVLANAGLAVHGYLKLYFESLNITENVEIEYGGILTNQASRGNIRIQKKSLGEDCVPQVWIGFDGTIINNTFVDMPDDMINQWYQVVVKCTLDYKFLLKTFFS